MAQHHKITGFKAMHPPMFVQTTDPASDPANDVQPFSQWIDSTTGTGLANGWVWHRRNTGNTAWDTVMDLAAIRGTASGLATLDSGGLIPTSQLPPLAINDTFVVASQAAMLALTAQRGDVAIRTDVSKTFILSTDAPGTLADWKEMVAGSAAPSGTAGGALAGSYPNPSLASAKLTAIAANTVATQAGTSYTAVLADADTYIQFTNAAAIAFTIPPNSSVAFPIGTLISVEQNGAGVVTLTAGAGVTLHSRGALVATAGQYAVAQLKKVATNTWTIAGDVA